MKIKIILFDLYITLFYKYIIVHIKDKMLSGMSSAAQKFNLLYLEEGELYI